MKTNDIKNIYNLIYKLNNEEFNLIIDMLKNKIEVSDKEIELLIRRYTLKDYDLLSMDDKEKTYNLWSTELYLNEIKKINMIINNDKLLQEIGGLKILLYGQTGTGKTSLVENIINYNNDIEYENIKWHNLVSPKLGQTQMNIMQLENELSNFKKKKIIFLDELDSLITNRNEMNDVSEYSRIVGTFIKFMDLLKPNIILIAATNLIDKIDAAIIRRFNVKIEGKVINFEMFYNFIDTELTLQLSTHEKNLLKEVFQDHNFTISEAKQFVSNYKIDCNLSSIDNNWAYILHNLNGVSKINLEKLSKNKKEEIERVIKKYGSLQYK
ncbi:AAA family ATPase [Spiroplasma tabanidicola]|uniref:AAA family ATPase n=1 Tax=Spiroplasma tabanidicola TaxID=324079 RepID=A0A6I6CB77_9MOLU|nr:ATP-binding protein [Spiroplasma tabanidicola]QGS51428.1 AAA family ATPase [Spiroplasma tabanidicola]